MSVTLQDERTPIGVTDAFGDQFRPRIVFRDAVHQVLEDERVIHVDSASANFTERLLASTAFASTLVIVLAWFRLGVEDEVSELQTRLVRATGI